MSLPDAAAPSRRNRPPFSENDTTHSCLGSQPSAQERLGSSRTRSALGAEDLRQLVEQPGRDRTRIVELLDGITLGLGQVDRLLNGCEVLGPGLDGLVLRGQLAILGLVVVDVIGDRTVQSEVDAATNQQETEERGQQNLLSRIAAAPTALARK